MVYFKYVKRNILRTPYQALAALMIMFLTFLCLTMFLLIAIGSQQSLKHLENKPRTIAFFKDNTADKDVQLLKSALMQTGKVSSVEYVSKEGALKIYRERNKDKPILLELVTASILPASLEIAANSPKDLEIIAAILKKEPVVEDVVYPRDVVQTLSNVTQVIRWVGAVIVSFLIIFTFLIILMIIGFKIRLRRFEIETVKLLGASKWFIRAPFLLEGISYGVVGAFLAWVVSYTILWYFTPAINKNLAELNLVPVSPLLMLVLLLIEFTVAVLIGAFSSYSALRRYLRL